MKVLVYGSGAREHAICWKLQQSKLLSELFLACPNDGVAELGEVIEHTSYEDLAKKSKAKGIGLAVIGPEVPLCEEIADIFHSYGIKVIGPEKKWAMLEGSKVFAKEFMERNNISTPKYSLITDIAQLKLPLNLPAVIKADGLCAGKGVTVAKTEGETINVINEYLQGKFNEASKEILLEEFIEGQELSLLCFWDGETLLPLIPARDYKKLLDGDNGPNTGGMGAFCPYRIDSALIDGYVKKLETALKKEKADFCGIIYSGLIHNKDGISVLEFNMRFGDPEAQVLLMHMESDLLEIFIKMTKKELKTQKIEWKSGISACFTVAAKGYPENPQKGSTIENLDKVCEKYSITPFFAGVKRQGGQLLANGGRVLSLCKTSPEPFEDIRSACEELIFQNKIYRSDIGEIF